MDKIEISHRTIIFTVFFLIGLWLIYKVFGVIILLFISYVLMAFLNPLVSKLEKWRLPRPAAILLSYAIVIAIITVILASIVPTLIEQTLVLSRNFSAPIADISLFKIDVKDFNNQIESLSRNILNLIGIITSAASNILAIFTIGVITFYLLMERNNFPKYIKALFGESEKQKITEACLDSIEKKLGGWIRAQIALMIIIGLFSYIGLKLLGISFALPLAMVAGLLEFIPNIGPTVSAIPAVIVAFTISPALAIGVIFLYIAIQQIENNLLVPQVMKKAIGIHPLVTITALMAGFSLAGIGGAVLAVPVFLVLQTLLQQIYANRKQ